MFAKTVEEAYQLVEAGFEHICVMDDIKICGKRKLPLQKTLQLLGGPVKKCGGWDSNPRTPSGQDLESRAYSPYTHRLTWFGYPRPTI